MVRFSLLIGCLCLAACGGKSSDKQPGSEVTSGGSRGGAPLPEQCSAFAKDSGTWSMRVLISNHTQLDLHLGPRQVTCGDVSLFQLADEAGAPLGTSSDCPRWCQGVMDGSFSGCLLLCVSPPSLTLAPGEVLEMPWSGQYLVSQELPEECLADPAELASCHRLQRIEPGMFTFTAEAGTELDCSETTGSSCEPCMPNEAGGCTTNSAVVGGKILQAKNQLKLDPGYGVGEGGPSGEPLPIELIFEE